MPRSHRLRPAAAVTVLASACGLLTAVPAAAAVTCASPAWQAQFYANTSFSGTPRRTACATTINENWGTGDPPNVTLPKDNFSVRWSVTRDFGSGGPFTLTAEARDGIRVYLDGARKISLWKDVSTTQKKTVNLAVPAGKHTLRVDFVAWTGSANVKFGYAPRTDAVVDKVKPLAPAGAAVSYSAAGDKATLSWTRNKEMDLAGYRLYRRLKGSTAWSRVATTTALSATDTPPASGATYYYEVRAYDKAGNESTGTADQAVATVDRTAPAAPRSVTATVNAATVRVGWQATADAQDYRVLRSATVDGAYTAVSDWLSGTTYADSAADIKQEWFYKVTARDAAGNVSAASAAGTTGAPDTTPPAAVTGLTGVGGSWGNLISWNASASPDVDHYEITASVVGEPDEDGPEIVTGTSFNDWNAPAGYQFGYRVQAVDAYGNLSPVTGVLVTRPRPADVPVPQVTTGAPRDDGNVVSFALPDGSSERYVYGYRLYRSADPRTGWTGVAFTQAYARGIVDPSAPAGRSYYYVVAESVQGPLPGEGASSGTISVDRDVAAYASAGPPQLTVVHEGSPGTGDFVVDVKPAEADRDHRLSGYQWRFYGACGSTVWRHIDGETGTLTWRPASTGSCTLQVYALGHYGRGDSTTAAVLNFTVS
ncbi:fibronectin type III domain-containing protein [Streptomyces sp. NPDC090798]|uniref:fibronectin type III domain-containing protein n=1 Tax=Streptomyces sp. NPDC090798 TaxID=3365968 RepID=UPI0037FD3655